MMSSWTLLSKLTRKRLRNEGVLVQSVIAGEFELAGVMELQPSEMRQAMISDKEFQGIISRMISKEKSRQS